MRRCVMDRSRFGSANRWSRGWFLGIALVVAGSGMTAWAQEAQPAVAARQSLARYVPRQDLIFMLEYEGLDAYPDAWRATAAYKLLTETKLGALMEDLAGQGLQMAFASAEQPPQIKPGEIIELVKSGVRGGFAFALVGKDPRGPDPLLVARGGDRPEVRRLLEAASAADRKRRGEEAAGPGSIEKAGRTLHRLDKETVWWFEKGDLVIANDADTILEVLDGKAPNAVDHPLRAALHKGGDGFQPVAVGFLEMSVLPPLPPQAIQLGLDGVKRIEFQWGFQDDALYSIIRAVAPAPRRGLLALLDQPTFGIDALPPLPPELHGFLVLSIDPGKTYDRIIEIAKKSNPQAANQIPMFEDAIQQQLGVNLREDILARIGPKLSFYIENPMGNVANPMLAMLTLFSGVTLSFDVHGVPGLARSLDTMIGRINDLVKQEQAARGGNAPAIELVKLQGTRTGYVLNLPPGSVPPGPFASIQPTLILETDRLVIAGTTVAARKALLPKKPASTWRPRGAYVPVARRLPDNMILLGLADPRDTIPAAVSMLPVLLPQINAAIGQAQRRSGRAGRSPMLQVNPEQVPTADELTSRLFPSSIAVTVGARGISIVSREPIPGVSSPPVLIALLLPAVQSAREAARRTQCTNNFKQIGLAMHNYLSANGGFPKPAITDKDGKPLLSWRVAILPYIEQQALYNKFKLDEPWDSPHNKALINEMPPTYVCPSRTNVAPGSTTYQVFVGPGALFEEGKTTRIQNVTDGTSNTLMVIEANRAVPWTKPDDLKFDPNAAPSLLGAWSNHPGGFDALFADGSVRFIKFSVSPQVIKCLITRSSGEVVSADQY
jgi:prepilin-type processing-associated H-X9-DG protein